MVGLIIGPRGTFQKRLEEETGCKILIRGGRNPNNAIADDSQMEEQHILILSDCDQKLE